MRSLLASLCLLAPKSTGISFEIHNGSGNLPFAMSQGDRAVITSPRHALAPPSDMFPSCLVPVPFHSCESKNESHFWQEAVNTGLNMFSFSPRKSTDHFFRSAES